VSGTRALRGQSPAGVHQPQQPSWTFIGAGSTPAHSGLTTSLATWQPATHNAATAAAAAAAAANLLWRTTPQLEQTAAGGAAVVSHLATAAQIIICLANFIQLVR